MFTNIIVVIFLFATLNANAFTIRTAELDNKQNLYLAIHDKKYERPVLIKQSVSDLSKKEHLFVPKDLYGFEFKKLISTQKGLIVLAQRNVIGPTAPQAWLLKDGRWKKITTLGCKDVFFQSYEKGVLTYDCYTQGHDGNEVISIKNETLLNNDHSSQRTLVSASGDDLILSNQVKIQGTKYSWDKLVIGQTTRGVRHLIQE